MRFENAELHDRNMRLEHELDQVKARLDELKMINIEMEKDREMLAKLYDEGVINKEGEYVNRDTG